MTFVRRIIPLLVFLCVSSVIFFQLITKPGIVGHTWDWGIPAFPGQYGIRTANELYVWNDAQSGGQYYPFKIELPYWLILMVLSPLGGEFLSKLLPFALLTLSMVSMYCLARRRMNLSYYWAGVTSLLYALSPYVYSRLIAGHLTILFGYSLFPLWIYFLDDFIGRNDSHDQHTFSFWILVVISPLLAIHFGTGILTACITVLYVAVSLIRYGEKRLVVRKVATLGLSTLLINAFWIIPFGQSAMSGAGVFIRRSESISQEVIRRVAYYTSVSQPLSRIVTLTVPSGLSTEFVYPTENAGGFVALSSAAIFAASLLGLFHLNRRKQNPVVTFVSILFILAVGIVSGSVNLVGSGFYWLLMRISPYVFAGFSNPLRFYPILLLPMAILSGMFLQTIEPRGVWKSWFRILWIVVLLLLWYPWLFRPLTKPVKEGDSQPLALKITPVHPDDATVFRMFRNDMKDYRIALLPPALLSWVGETNHEFAWASGYYGKPVFLQHLDQPIADPILTNLYSPGGSRNLSRLLGLANVKTIVYPDYQSFESYKSFIHGIRNYKPFVDRSWTKQMGIEKVWSETASISLYHNEDFVPHIYVPNQTVLLTSEDRNGFVEVVEQEGYATRSAIFTPEDGEVPGIISSVAADSVYVRPTCVGCSDIEVDQTLLNPIPRFLPTSFFYYFVRNKEEKFLRSLRDVPAVGGEVSMAFGLKKLREMRMMIEKSTDTSTLAMTSMQLFHTYLDAYIALRNSTKDRSSEQNTLYAKSIIFFNKQYEDLLEIYRTAHSAEIQESAKRAMERVSDLFVFAKDHVWMTENIRNLRYEVNIPETSAYELLVKSGVRNEKGSVVFDSGETVMLPNAMESPAWVAASTVTLPKGSHRFKAELTTENDVRISYSTGSAVSQEGKDTVLRSQSLPVVVPVTVSDMAGDLRYGIRMKYMARGKPVRVVFEQEYDETVRDLKAHQVDTLLESTGTMTTFTAMVVPDPRVTSGRLQFYLPPDDKGATTITISDLVVEPYEPPRFLLRKTNPPEPSHETPMIEISKLNPTRYTVHVRNAIKPFMLVFSESFHPGWKAFISSQKDIGGPISATYFGGQIREYENRSWIDISVLNRLFQTPINEKYHARTNGYANAWFIEKTGDYTIELEFVGQRLYDAALIISVLAFFYCVIRIVTSYRRNNV